jgi:hypothetical protein
VPLHGPSDTVHQAAHTRIAWNEEPHPSKITPGPTLLSKMKLEHFAWYQHHTDSLV